MTKNKGYKRSWKNLLLNKRYQLRFTLTMVGLSAVLMGLLGWWVMTVAERATKVAINNVLGEEVCRDPALGAAMAPEAVAPEGVTPGAAQAEAEIGAAGEPGGDTAGEAAAEAAAAAAAEIEAAAEAETAAAAATEAEAAAEAGAEAETETETETEKKTAGDSAAEGETGEAGDHPVVMLEESSMQIIEPPPSAAAPAVDPALAQKKFEECKAHQAAQIRSLEDRKRLILWVLVGVGVVLVMGLLVYGIKMTHKVAGPLHKVSLYMAKMRDGTFDKVYDLRKGDHLVDFYDHFKAAHAGVVKWQEEDLTRLDALITAADEADLASRSPEAAAALTELRALRDRKRASLGKKEEV